MSISLFNDDCLAVLPTLQEKSVDLVLCDLPYGTTQCSWDSLIDLPALWAEYKRVCKDNAALLLFAQTPFDKVLGCSNLSWLRYEWIWEKPAATGFFNAKKMPMKAHENILVFYNKLPVYNPQITTGHVLKQARRKDVVSKVYGKAVKKTNYSSTDRYPRSVQTFSKTNDDCGYHPTQKPVSLLEYLILTYSNPNAVVLDNTMGSGSTGVACVNTGRRFVGIEKDSTYFKTAESRINDARSQISLEFC